MTHQHNHHHHRGRPSVYNHYNDQSNRHSSQSVNHTLLTNGDSLEHHDQQSNIYFQQHANHHHNRVPPPCSSNLHPIDSPSYTSRRGRDDYEDNEGFSTIKSKKHKQSNRSFRNDDDVADVNQQLNQHNSRSPASPQQFTSNPPPHNYPTRYQQNQRFHQLSPTNNTRNTLHNASIINDSQQVSSPSQRPQQYNISTAATRYAQTRFPFSPFTIRFSSGSVKAKQVADELVQHFTNNHQFDLQLTNIRQSTTKCTQQDYDFLIYVKNADSFCALYLQDKWPHVIGGQRYTFLSPPSFPAQLSLVVRNVDLRMNLHELTDELKIDHPEILNVIRLKNKFQNEIKMLKIEMLSTTVREELLKERRIKVMRMVYDIDEYLSPADVLICSRCCGIGHFKRQCQELNETCRTCGINCPDLRQHTCSNEIKCVHCGGSHASNSLRCAVVKDYRAALTKKLLSTNTPANKNFNYVHDPAFYPSLQLPQGTTLPSSYAASNQKIEELLSGMNEMKFMLNRLCSKEKEFNDFMVNKNKNDELMLEKIERIITNDKITKEACDNNDKLIKRLILPTLDLISNFLVQTNPKATGNVVTEFKSQIQIKRALIDQIISGKKVTL
ncbi:unnamed protein product [Adineta steineri]|uniref:CCHC-type domain-containing protein n=1 Tax=Adineta steineri TaxID=433720 RepID=A0A815KBJ8_9BILA|nr:unnamed protein product [Adineta steineri]CAF1393828.1 unnamed protein product [Adineta steineri]